MKKTLALLAALSLALAAGSAEAKQCRDAAGKFITCPAASAAHKAAKGASDVASATGDAASKAGKSVGSAMSSATGGHPQCKTGKPCGNSCIAKDKVCHK